MYPTLRLYEDVLANGAEASWPALPRMIFVVHGAVTIADRTLRDEDTFGSEAPVTLKAGSGGATLWRWELAPDGAAGAANAEGGIRTREKLAARLETAPKGALLLRGDGVAFPPGGCAYLHRHQGPGHPLRHRRRHPHRHPRPLDVIRSGRGMVRDRPRRRFRARRGPPDAVHSRHDPAARLFGKKLDRISQ